MAAKWAWLPLALAALAAAVRGATARRAGILYEVSRRHAEIGGTRGGVCIIQCGRGRWLGPPCDLRTNPARQVWHSRASDAMRTVRDKGGVQLTTERVIQSDGVQHTRRGARSVPIRARVRTGAQTLDDVYGPYGLSGDIWNVEPELGFYCMYRPRWALAWEAHVLAACGRRATGFAGREMCRIRPCATA
jgi:hypothetical protein